ncbi:MAG: HEAT repeat domain-containing protein [Acidobacteria bacterium]|nr:HEAT repeat domain-containing protein [Acidobacteriota bacterium]
MADRDELKKLSTQALFEAILIGEPDDEDAWDAIYTLRVRATQEVFDRAVAYFRSDDPKKRGRGLDVLGQLGARYPDNETRFVDHCVTFAIEGLADPDGGVVSSAAWALVFHDSEKGKTALTKMMRHPDAYVRQAVAQGVSPCDTEEKLRAAIELMEDEDDEVRDWATFSLGTQCKDDSPEIRAALRKRLQDPYADARDEGIWGLAQRKDPEGLKLLLHRLEQDTWVKGDEYAAETVLDLIGSDSVEELRLGLRALIDRLLENGKVDGN